VRVRTLRSVVRTWVLAACYCEGVRPEQLDYHHYKRTFVGALSKMRAGEPPGPVRDWVFDKVHKMAVSSGARWREIVAEPKKH
jgi:hypothetical protein